MSFMPNGAQEPERTAKQMDVNVSSTSDDGFPLSLTVHDIPSDAGDVSSHTDLTSSLIEGYSVAMSHLPSPAAQYTDKHSIELRNNVPQQLKFDHFDPNAASTPPPSSAAAAPQLASPRSIAFEINLSPAKPLPARLSYLRDKSPPREHEHNREQRSPTNAAPITAHSRHPHALPHTRSAPSASRLGSNPYKHPSPIRKTPESRIPAARSASRSRPATSNPKTASQPHTTTRGPTNPTTASMSSRADAFSPLSPARHMFTHTHALKTPAISKTPSSAAASGAHATSGRKASSSRSRPQSSAQAALKPPHSHGEASMDSHTPALPSARHGALSSADSALFGPGEFLQAWSRANTISQRAASRHRAGERQEEEEGESHETTDIDPELTKLSDDGEVAPRASPTLSTMLPAPTVPPALSVSDTLDRAAADLMYAGASA